MIIKLLATASLILGCLIAVSNWYSIYASHRFDRNVSPVPIFGALLLALGMLGFQQTRPYAWAGILADWGTIAFILAVPDMTWEAWTTSRLNLLHRFTSEINGRYDDIRLFKRGKFTIKTEYTPPIPCNKHGACITSQGRIGSWKLDGECFYLEGYADSRVTKIKNEDGDYITEEDDYPDSEEFQYDRMGGLRLDRIV
jgi:hypothetical protein